MSPLPIKERIENCCCPSCCSLGCPPPSISLSLSLSFLFFFSFLFFSFLFFSFLFFFLSLFLFLFFISFSFGHSIFFTLSTKMDKKELDEWIELTKECKYLPEPYLRRLCEMVLCLALRIFNHPKKKKKKKKKMAG